MAMSMLVRIENQKTYKGEGFRIGRPTPLGNPFKIDAENSRNKVIEQYRGWLLEKLDSDNPTSRMFVTLLDELQDNECIILICHCAPLRCHGDVIKEFLLEACNGGV